MKLRPYKIQKSYQDAPKEIFFHSRVDYEKLISSLVLPIVWSYDYYHQGWLPAELFKEIEDCSPQELLKLGVLDPENRRWWEDLQLDLARDGFVKIPQLIALEYARGIMTDYYWRDDSLLQRWPDMTGIKRRSANNLPLMQLLHENVQLMTRYIVQPEPIKTSYSFSASYEEGSSLPRHTDRPQCVWNISLMLSGDGDLKQWPLFIQRGETTNRVELEAGDAVLYSGTRDPHWRDPMPKMMSSVLGVFFHFVPESFSGSLD